MANILYLVHRLPYPPNKGDKVRSYHLLKHLAESHRVFLGTFVDDPDDLVHLPVVRKFCADMLAVNLNPLSAKAKSLIALVTGEALTVRFYASDTLQDWVEAVVAKERIDAVVVFSSAMGQYVPSSIAVTVLVDFVDVDSAKWTQYGEAHRWPMSWLYRREGRELLLYERSLAQRAQKSFFVTEKETRMFRALAPESLDLVDTISNGVDADFFSPDANRANPFAPDHNPTIGSTIVFTGAMDYWPNVDAVTWFVSDILPSILNIRPQTRFYIVGRSPPAMVLALANNNIFVTGTVPDVRPFLQFASLVVAPLRVARGIQNKILEAMAMGRPVVASESCAQAMDVTIGKEILSAKSAADFVREIVALLGDPERATNLGRAGRLRVVGSYSWSAHLAHIDRYLVPKSFAEVPA